MACVRREGHALVRDQKRTGLTVSKKFPLRPAHPERVCWGCDQFCSAHDMRCGNGSDRTAHPAELFGDDWFEWGTDATGSSAQAHASLGGPLQDEDRKAD